MLNLEQLVDAIVQRVKGRYDLCGVEEGDPELPEVSHKTHLFRLKRTSITRAGKRTILLIELPSASIHEALQWAADVRDVLPEPETSDLYMFLVISDITENEAIRIETDDRFCRKVVVREAEETTDFLDRTFLAALDPAGDVEMLSDPLVSALVALSSSHPWVSPYINTWKDLLLSNQQGADVFHTLNASLSGAEEKS